MNNYTDEEFHQFQLMLEQLRAHPYFYLTPIGFQITLNQLWANMNAYRPFCPPTYAQQENQYVFSGPSRHNRNGRHHTVAPYHYQLIHGAFGTTSMTHPVGTHPQMGANYVPGGQVQDTRWNHTPHSHQGNQKIREKHGADPSEYQVAMGMSIA